MLSGGILRLYRQLETLQTALYAIGQCFSRDGATAGADAFESSEESLPVSLASIRRVSMKQNSLRFSSHVKLRNYVQVEVLDSSFSNGNVVNSNGLGLDAVLDLPY